MQLEIGKIAKGKVTGITKFGAFIELESGEVGMVHISEVAPTYVNDISEHLKDGQMVTVKILSINEDGKISLSIKKAMPPVPRQEGQGFQRPAGGGQGSFRSGGNGGQNRDGGRGNTGGTGGARTGFQKPAGGNAYGGNRSGNFSRPAANKNGPPGGFEDMLSKFIQSSDEKISDIKKSREVSRRGGQKRSK